MAYQEIDLGVTAGDGTGDTVRAGGTKLNANFVEIYTLLGTGTALTSGISADATVVTLSSPIINEVAKFAAQGDAGTPVITQTNDTNTGIFFSDADELSVTTGGGLRTTVNSTGLIVQGNVTATGTVEPAGDTTVGDNAAIGYTSVEGLILTGQGSTSDITLKNDADGTVFTVPTGTDDILFPDGAKAMFGASSDLQIYHDGSNSYVTDTGTGDLMLRASNDIFLSNVVGNSIYGRFAEGGAVSLYHNGSVKFVTSSAGGTLTGTWEVTTALVPDASDGAALGTTALEWSDLFLADGAVISFGDDDDVTLTHVADTGLLLNGTNVIQFNDASQNIGAPSNAILDINATDEIELNSTLIDVNGNLDVSGTGVIAGAVTTAALTASGIIKTDDTTAATNTTDGSLQTDGGLSVAADAVIGDDIIMLSDAAQIAFGTNSEITLAHVHNVGLTLTHVTAGDNLPVVFQLKSEEDIVVANEVIGSIEFAAGDSDGTDGATVAAGIHAIAEGTFSATANATKLVFTTGVSETAASSATAKATLSSIGDFTVAGDLIIKDGGSLGSASDLNAMTISSGGVIAVTATTASTNATSGALTVAGGAGIAADLSVGDDVRLISDAAVLSFGADADVTLTHVADTGLLLNSTMAIQFNDASQYINAPSNAILDINATDEIELNATLVDVNANLDVSGTYTGAGLMTTGGNIVIPDAGNIGSASDTDAIAISSGGVATFNQIPIFSAGINVSSGNIAGTLSTAAQGNITSLGTLTTLTVDNIIVNGSNIGHTSDTDSIAIASNGVVTFSQSPVFSTGINIAYIDLDGATEMNADVVDADLFMISDGGGSTMRSMFASRLKAYIVENVGAEADNITGGDAAVNLSTTVGNITIDAEGSDTDIILKGTDGGVDTTFLTLDGSAAGEATFNAGIVIADAGNIGSASDKDAIAIASDGVVTFSQIPVLPDNTVSTADIQADAITGAKIADNAINSEHYTDGSIDTAHIAAGQVTVAKMAINSIDSAQYVDGSIDREHLAADIVDGTKIANDAINSEHYAADSIDAEHYAPGSVDATAIGNDVVNSQHYAAASIDREHLAADIIDGTKIADDVINSEHYAAGSIDTEHIADANITVAKMAANSIDSAQYVDGSIDTAHYTAGSVDATALASNAVTSAKINSAAVTTAKINSAAVTTAKIANDAIDSQHYAADSIDAEHYAPGSVDATALASNAVTSAKIADATIVGADIAANTVAEANMANDAIGSAELKTLSTLLIINSAGTTLKTIHGAGA
jgi:hypothetical protein